MYNEKIENLINFALADGELTEKEKQILFKKAEEAGIDLDEFEMVLDAKLHEKQQNAKQPVAPTTSAPKSDKYGDVKKCPSCGAIVQSFSGKCGDCGYEFRDIQSDVTINKLFEALMEADNIPKEEFKEMNTKEGGFMGKLTYNPAADKLQNEQRLKKHEQAHKEKIQARKIQIISNFPVPNTKEPLLEFLTLGISKATPIKVGLFSKATAAQSEHNALVSAWKSKIDQVVMKAKMSMKEDKSLLAEIDNMVAQLNSKK
jgi:hypothetical protein